MSKEPSPSAAPYIPSLDGIRAASFLVVFLSHAGLDHWVPGLFGVTVFFFLSGYLITTLSRLEYDQTDGIRAGHFYFRRALRILPPLYLVLAGTVLLTTTGVVSGEFSWWSVVAQALFVANYYENFGGGPLLPGTGVLWSLAVEEHFYLFFPFLYLALRRWVKAPQRQYLVLLGLSALILAWRCFRVFQLVSNDALDPQFNPSIAHGTDTRLDCMLLGCALAVYGNPALDPARCSRHFLLYVATPAALVVLASTFLYRNPIFRETLRYTLQSAALAPLFVATIRYPDWFLFRILNLRWIRFVGVLSYTLYLCHATLLDVFRQQLPRASELAVGLLGLGLSLAVSAGMYYGVEKPCARLRRQMLHGSAQPRTEKT